MYVNLALKFSDFDKMDPRTIIQYYRINDTTFRHDFTAHYIRDAAGTLNDVHHLNQILTNIYYAYKFSKQSLCKNFSIVMKTTFSQAGSQIKQTQFYKEHRALVDKSLEGKTNVIKY